MRSDFQLIFAQMAKLGPIDFEDLLCRHSKLASDLFTEVGDSCVDEVVQRSARSDWGLDASNMSGWETVNPWNHSELMDALSVVFDLVDACVDEDLEFDFLADFLAHIGSEHYEAGDLASSMDCFEIAHRYAQTCGNLTGVADLQERIGDVELQRQDLACAFESFKRALFGREAIQDFRGVGRCLLKIAVLLEKSGQRIEAIEFLNGAIKVLIKHGKAYDRFQAHVALGTIFASDRQLENAREQLVKAEAARAESDDSEEESEMYPAVNALQDQSYERTPLPASSRRWPSDRIRLRDILKQSASTQSGPIEFRGPMIERLEHRLSRLRFLRNQGETEEDGS